MLSLVSGNRRYVAIAVIVLLVLVVPLGPSRFSGPVHHKLIPWPSMTVNRDNSGPPLEALGKDGPVFKEHEGTLFQVLAQIGMAEVLGKAASIMELDPNVRAKAIPEFGDWINSLRIKTDDGREFLFLGGPDFPLHLTSYHLENYQHAPRRLKHKDAIPAQRAKEKAQALVEALEVDFDLSGCRPTLQDWDNADDLDCAAWSVEGFRRYQGYETGSYAKVYVSAYAEEVLSLLTMPQIIPQSMDVKITTSQAHDIVQSFAANRSLSLEGLREPALDIVEPNSVWVEAGEPERKPDIVHPRLAYRVSGHIRAEDPDSRGSSCEFWVDAATGGLIGGSMIPDYGYIVPPDVAARLR